MATSKYLESVPEDHALRLNDEKVAHSLEELHSMMESSGPEVFYMHVNDMSNDVADWTRNIIGYNDLADKMKAATDRDEFLKLLSDSINELKNPPAPVVPAQPIVSPAAPSINISAPPIPPAAAQSTAKIDMFAPDAVPSPIPAVAPATNTYISVSQSPSVNISAPFTDNNTAPANSVPSPVQTTQALPVMQPVAAVPVSVPVNSAPAPANASPAVPLQAPQVQAPISAPVQQAPTVTVDPKLASISAAMSFMNEERFDFEDIFNILLYELEQEVLVLE